MSTLTQNNFNVFISYNSKEKEYVSKIVNKLRNESKFNVWFDQADMQAGVGPEDEARIRLKESNACIIFLGKNGWGPYHLIEAKIASELPHLLIIPVLLPNGLIEVLQEVPILSKKIYVDFRYGIDNENEFRLLWRSILGRGRGFDPLLEIHADARKWEKEERKWQLLTPYSFNKLKKIEKIKNEYFIRSEIGENKEIQNDKKLINNFIEAGYQFRQRIILIGISLVLLVITFISGSFYLINLSQAAQAISETKVNQGQATIVAAGTQLSSSEIQNQIELAQSLALKATNITSSRNVGTIGGDYSTAILFAIESLKLYEDLGQGIEINAQEALRIALAVAYNQGAGTNLLSGEPLSDHGINFKEFVWSGVVNFDNNRDYSRDFNSYLYDDVDMKVPVVFNNNNPDYVAFTYGYGAPEGQVWIHQLFKDNTVSIPFNPYEGAIDPGSGGKDRIIDLKFGSDNLLAVTKQSSVETDSYVLEIWDTLEPTIPLAVFRSDYEYPVVAFHPDGELIAVGDASNIFVFNSTNDLQKNSYLTIDFGSYLEGAIEFSPDGDFLVANTQDGIKFWKTNELDNEPMTLNVQEYPALFQFSKDGQHFIVTSLSTSLFIWELDDIMGEPITLKASDTVDDSLIFFDTSNGDESSLISVTQSGRLTVWNLNHLEAQPKILSVNTFLNKSYSLSPDGRFFAVNDGGKVYLYDLVYPQKLPMNILVRLSGQEGVSPIGIAFDATSRYIVIVHSTGTRLISIYPNSLYNIACKAARRNFTRTEWDAFVEGIPFHLTCPFFPEGWAPIPTP